MSFLNNRFFHLQPKNGLAANLYVAATNPFPYEFFYTTDEDQLYVTDTSTIAHPVGGRIVRVSTQFDKTNSAALANVTGLTLNIINGYSYSFRAVLHVAPDATGGAKYAIGGTATASAIVYQVNSINNGTNLNILNSRQTALGGAAGVVGGTADFTTIDGLITASATGTLTVQFAQNTATPATTSSVLVGSTFQMFQVV